MASLRLKPEVALAAGNDEEEDDKHVTDGHVGELRCVGPLAKHDFRTCPWWAEVHKET